MPNNKHSHQLQRGSLLLVTSGRVCSVQLETGSLPQVLLKSKMSAAWGRRGFLFLPNIQALLPRNAVCLARHARSVRK